MTVLDLKIINKETNKEGCYIFFYEWRSFAIEKLLVD